MRGSLVLPACLLCFYIFHAAPARADGNEALMQLLGALHDNGTIDDDTYRLIRQTARGEDGAPARAGGEEAPVEPELSVVADRVSEKQLPTRAPPPEEGNPYDPTVVVGVRMHIDAAAYDEDVRRHNDGTELRRATVDVSGRLGENWGYKLQYDFTDTGEDGISHAWIDYLGFDRFSLRLGHVKEPYSLDNMGSSNYTTFVERALPYDAFAEGRNLGLRLRTRGRAWTYEIGVFGKDMFDDREDNDAGGGISNRFTYAPILRDRHVLHLGGAVSWRATGSDSLLRFRARPESHVTDTRLVDTGHFNAESFLRLGAEFAWIDGSLSLLSEYMGVKVDRGGFGPDLGFDGYYVEGSWFLTGESMNYRKGRGTIGNVIPSSNFGYGGWGALQLATRFSHLDLSDGDIDGGVEDNFTMGVNWYPLPYLRFSADYIKVLDVRGGPNDGDEPQIFSFRSQIVF